MPEGAASGVPSPEFRVSDFGFRVSDFGFRVPDFAAFPRTAWSSGHPRPAGRGWAYGSAFRLWGGQTRDDEERVALWRQLAPKYGCEVAEVREALRASLREHGLYPKDTLADSVHPNALGNFLIRKLVAPPLR